MRAYRHFLNVLLLAGLWVVANPAAAADCGRRIAAEGPSARTVALAGGDSWTLMRDYFSEVKQRDLDVSRWKLQVVIQSRGKQETFELGWGKMLTGESAEKLWERLLNGKRAEPSPELLAQAQRNNWDLICVGMRPPPPPIRRLPVPSPNTQLSQASPDGDALIYFKSGVQYASRRDYANALKEFKEAEKRNKQFPGLLMNIGVTYMQLKDYVRASDYLTRAVAQSPFDASTRLNMACLQTRLGQFDDAVASLTAAKRNGMKMTAAVRRDPDLTALRGRSEFETLFEPAGN